MKKVVLILVAMLGISFAGKAQVQCQIQNGEGSTVMATDQRLEGDHVIVTLENDSQDISANVTVTVEVKYKNRKTKTFQGFGKCLPSQSNFISVKIDLTDGQYEWDSYSVVAVKGNKCS